MELLLEYVVRKKVTIFVSEPKSDWEFETKTGSLTIHNRLRNTSRSFSVIRPKKTHLCNESESESEDENEFPPILFRSVKDWNLLRIAARNRNEKVVKLLLQFAIDQDINLLPFFQLSEKNNPIYVAAGNENEKVMDHLLQFIRKRNLTEINVFKLNSRRSRKSPLCKAVRLSNEKVLELLLEYAKEKRLESLLKKLRMKRL